MTSRNRFLWISHDFKVDNYSLGARIQDHPDSTRFDQLEISRCSCCRLTGLPFGPCLPDGPVIGWTNFTEMVRSSERKPSSQVVAGKRSRINIDDIDIDDINDIDDIDDIDVEYMLS